MTIGQMMWWRPQGEIELYDGKYQGAVGPRSSDIHKDFDRQLSRQRLPGLGTDVDPAEVGHKFASLAAVSRELRVPAAFAVPVGEFTQALGDGARGRLGALFEEMRATVGAFFTELTAGIEAAVADLTMPPDLRELVTARLADVFGDLDEGEFAVRSSGLAEEGESSSLAGIHRSVLGARGADGVIAAVEECGRSHYAAAAVAARVRAGDFDPEPRLAVIVQRLARPRWAGVAFTGLDEGRGEDDSAGLYDDPVTVEIEYTEGLAEDLVAGAAVPASGPASPASSSPTRGRARSTRTRTRSPTSRSRPSNRGRGSPTSMSAP